MKLNHDCIRDIMLYLEENTSPSNEFIQFSWLERDLPSYDLDTLTYHCEQLESAGFVDEVNIYFKNGAISKLNWKGREYLDNIRDKSAWGKLKESGLSSMSLDVAISLIKEIALALAKEKLHLK